MNSRYELALLANAIRHLNAHIQGCGTKSSAT